MVADYRKIWFFLLIFIIIIMPLIIPFPSIASDIDPIDEWVEVKDKESITSAIVFSLDLHSWFESEYLENNEFLQGDIIDYITLTILRRKPDHLKIEPIHIIFTSPNKIRYKLNFYRAKDIYENDVYINGQITKDINKALVHLNESGIWSIEIEYNESIQFPCIYSGQDPSQFELYSKIEFFVGKNINVYTNLEYQQLRVAKAMEDSTRMSIISTIALFVAAVAAVVTIIVYWLIYKEEKKEKMLDKWVECKSKFDDVLLDLLILVTEVKTWLISFNKLDKISDHHYTNYSVFDNKIKILHKKCLQNLLYVSKYPVESGNFIKKTKKIIDKLELIIDIWNKLQIPFTNDDSKNKINEIIADIDEIIDDIDKFLNYE